MIVDSTAILETYTLDKTVKKKTIIVKQNLQVTLYKEVRGEAICKELCLVHKCTFIAQELFEYFGMLFESEVTFAAYILYYSKPLSHL